MEKSETWLICNTHYSTAIGGSELQCHFIAEELLRQGCSVHYAALNGIGRDAVTESYTLHIVERGSYRDAFKLIQEIKPDYIYWRNNWVGFLPVGFAAYSKHIKLIFALCSMADAGIAPSTYSIVNNSVCKAAESLSARKRVGRWSKQLAREVNRLGAFFVSGWVANSRALANGIFRGRKMNTIYNAWPNSVSFSQNKQSRVIWVGNIKANKRPEIVIELARRLPHIEFMMVGAIHDPRYWESITADGIPLNCNIKGSMAMEEADCLIKGSRVLIHTGLPEGFTNVLIQAWRHGVPTITYDFDPDGLIEKYGTGYVAGSLDQMERHIRDLVNNEDEWLTMSRQGRELIANKFSLEANVMALRVFAETL